MKQQERLKELSFGLKLVRDDVQATQKYEEHNLMDERLRKELMRDQLLEQAYQKYLTLEKNHRGDLNHREFALVPNKDQFRDSQ